MKTIYEIVKTSQRNYRIKLSGDSRGTRFLGGKHSRRYLFSTEQQAQKYIDICKAADERFERTMSESEESVFAFAERTIGSLQKHIDNCAKSESIFASAERIIGAL